MINYYAVLGMPPASSIEDLRIHYRELVRTKHPDRGGNTYEFQAITEAGSVLTDVPRRRDYDAFMRLLMDPCSVCGGQGVKRIQMSFSNVVSRRCDTCKGEGFHERRKA